MATQFVDAKEVAETLEVSVTTAYRIIRALNKELEKQGYLTISGRVSRRYFEDRVYIGEQTKPTKPGAFSNWRDA